MFDLRIGTRFLVAVAASLLLAGCGGGDGDSTASNSKKVDREGYFTKAQSEAINPVLTDYNTASGTISTKHETCNTESDKLYNAGKSERQSVQCHLDQTAAMVAAIESFDKVLTNIDGDKFRSACSEQVDETRTFVAKFRDAWTAVHSDWEKYASGKALDAKLLEKHFTAAVSDSDSFVNRVLRDLTTACYTKADRETANAKEDADA